MPVARSLHHLDLILERFRDDPLHHLDDFRKEGHLDDLCGVCLAMLDDVGATHEEARHIFEDTPRDIRERVRAAIVQGVDNGLAVKFVGVMTRDAEPSVDVGAGDPMIVTFLVPLRPKIEALAGRNRWRLGTRLPLAIPACPPAFGLSGSLVAYE